MPDVKRRSKQAVAPAPLALSDSAKRRLVAEKAAELRHSAYLPVTKAVGVCRQVTWAGEKEGVWPHSSTSCCWHCAHPFDSSPVGLPVAYDDRENKWRLKGNFCSFNCAKAHIRDKNQSNAAQMINRLSQLALYVHRCPAWDKPSHEQGKAAFPGVRAAPPKEALKMFGGWMDIAEFRANCWSVRAARVSELLVEWTPQMLATKLPQDNTNSRVTERVAGKQYALQRTAPLFRHKTLDSYMKINTKAS